MRSVTKLIIIVAAIFCVFVIMTLIQPKSTSGVERRLNLGGTMICFNALRAADLDLYVEYTGTGLVNIMEEEAIADPDEAYKVVADTFEEEYGLIWLEPLGFNNTYTLTMRRGHAEELGIETISDLAEHINQKGAEINAGFDAEFIERSDGYPGLSEHYGLEISGSIRQMDPGLMYRAARDGDVDVINAFATDGRIEAYDLLVLEDDKQFFPPYYAAPLVREDTLNLNPWLREVLNKPAGLLSDDLMREMNYRVDEENERAIDVAKDFLLEHDLIEPEPVAQYAFQDTLTVGSKHFTEQEILGEMMALLIEHYTGAMEENDSE